MVNDYIFLATASSSIFALVNIIDKFVLSKFIKNPLIPLFLMAIVGLVFSFAILCSTGVPDLAIDTHALIALSGLLNLLAAYFYIKALLLDDVSKLIPLFFLSPLLILPFSYFLLNESYSSSNLIGILFLIIGGIMVTMNETFKIVFNKALKFIILCLICTPLFFTITKYTSNDVDAVQYFALMRVYFFIFLIPLFALSFREIYTKHLEEVKLSFKFVVGNQILNSVGIILSILAVQKGKVAIVSALSSIQPVLVLLISYLLFSFFPNISIDKLNKKVFYIRGLAVLFLVLGTYLVSKK